MVSIRATVVLTVLFSLCLVPYQSRAQRLVPSFEEEAPYVNEHPRSEPSMAPFVRSWNDSPGLPGRGGFIERAVFTPGDPNDPKLDGAMLKYLKVLSHGLLLGNSETEKTVHADEQVIFYVLEGTARIESGGSGAVLEKGMGIFIPAGVDYRFINSTGAPFDVVILVEGIPDGFSPAKKMKVIDFNEMSVSYWGGYTTHGMFSRNDGLAEPMGISVITMEHFGTGVPHYHLANCEEIWLKLDGEENLLILGKQLLKQNIGTAFLAPELVPHSAINHTESTMTWLYIGNRRDRE